MLYVITVNAWLGTVVCVCCFFFFQAEDGIRDRDVTGVQTVLFRSFRHSTCSLSVSYVYLALEEVYLPLCAPVSRYTTLRPAALALPGHRRRGSHPLRRPPRRHFCVQARLRPPTFRLQFAELKPGDYHCGLFPLPSPVLRESLLVSFPPLNDMLKFSGSSYFISGAEIEERRVGKECRSRWSPYH